MLITDTIASFAEKIPNRAAIVFEDTCLAYKKLNFLINQTANALLSTIEEMDISVGIQGQPREEQYIVAILLDNSIELLLAFLASARIGWIGAILDPKWKPSQLQNTIYECQPQVLITNQKYFRFLHSIPDKTKVIVVAETLKNENDIVSYQEWIACKSTNAPPVEVSNQDLFYMGFTSGTTGNPKGFVRSHESWIESFDVSSSKMFDLHSDHHILAPGPLAHSLSLYAAVHTLFIGGTFYFVGKFDANTVLQLLSDYRITHIYLVPTMFEGIFHAGHLQSTLQTEPFRAPGVLGIISSGDKWTSTSKQRATQIFPNAQLIEFYGASELSFVTVLDPTENEHKSDSVGKPVKNLEISIRDENGNEVHPGAVGQLFVKSKMVFVGYYHNEAETHEVLRGEWATVGDLVRQDEDGFIYIVGRKKNMIISGGLNIYPEEIERVLFQHPAIDEVAVVGIPDDYWGQKVAAIFTCKTNIDRNFGVEELKNFCRANLPSYKCPKEFFQADFLPHTQSGKIARKEVYAQVLARMCE